MRDKIRLKHCSIRTEQPYVQWVLRYILHHDKRHLAEMGSPEVEAFLTHLAVELPWLDTIELAKKPKQLPVVLVLQMRMESTHWLMPSTGHKSAGSAMGKVGSGGTAPALIALLICRRIRIMQA